MAKNDVARKLYLDSKLDDRLQTFIEDYNREIRRGQSDGDRLDMSKVIRRAIRDIPGTVYLFY